MGPGGGGARTERLPFGGSSVGNSTITHKVLAPAVRTGQVRPRPRVPGRTQRAFARACEGVRARRAVRGACTRV